MPKIHKIELHAEVKTSGIISGTGFKAGLSKAKGWFQKFFTGVNVKQADGTFVDVTSSMKRKRFGNWYSEKVVNSVTGVVTRECEEPLTVHQGHGSDKPGK